VTTDADRQTTSEKLQVVIDQWPVVCEDFLQWVVEDNFVAGRPQFEKAGVQMVPDVEPYEYMKLRLLNAGHQAIAYFGLLFGFEYVHDVTRHEVITKFLRDYMEEATSTLKPLPGIDVAAYKAKIVERFQNSYVKDTLARLAVDGSDRVFKFVIPVIVDRLKNNESIYLSTAIIASFAYYINGVNEKGQDIQIVDRAKENLLSLSKKLKNDSKLIKDEHEMLGEVVRDERFVKTFEEIYEMIKKDGSEATLKWLTKNSK
jgi:mannitol 2-dehydrogenase